MPSRVCRVAVARPDVLRGVERRVRGFGRGRDIDRGADGAVAGDAVVPPAFDLAVDEAAVRVRGRCRHQPVVAVDEPELLVRLRARQPDLVDAAVRDERRGLRVREVDAGMRRPVTAGPDPRATGDRNEQRTREGERPDRGTTGADCRGAHESGRLTRSPGRRFQVRGRVYAGVTLYAQRRFPASRCWVRSTTTSSPRAARNTSSSDRQRF